jgi:hypothetical protein
MKNDYYLSFDQNFKTDNSHPISRQFDFGKIISTLSFHKII